MHLYLLLKYTKFNPYSTETKIKDLSIIADSKTMVLNSLKEVKFNIMNDLEKKDKILKYFDNHREGFYSSNFLNELVFKDTPETETELRNLVNLILRNGYLSGTVARFQYDPSLTQFLKDGGYTGQEAKRKKDLKANKDSYKVGRWNKKTFWIAFVILVLTFILTLIALFK